MLIPGSEVIIPGMLLRVKGDRAHVQLTTGALLVTDAATLEAREVEEAASGVEVGATEIGAPMPRRRRGG